MSNLFGLILQSNQKQTQVSNLNLLIINDEGGEIEAIVTVLEKVSRDFTYSVISVEESSLYLSDLACDAILYNYSLQSHYQTPSNPLDKIPFWQKIKKITPLILITDVLGDEIAIECVKAGISGYVLRHKLYTLPTIIEKSIASFFFNNRQ